MGWELVVTVVSNICIAVFVYGRLTERVRGQSDSIEAIEAEQVRQWGKLDNHEGRISRLEGQRFQ